MTNSKELRKRIKDKGLKLKFVAKELGLSPYGLKRKIDNEQEFKTSEIIMLCKILDITSLREKEEIFFVK